MQLPLCEVIALCTHDVRSPLPFRSLPTVSSALGVISTGAGRRPVCQRLHIRLDGCVAALSLSGLGASPLVSLTFLYPPPCLVGDRWTLPPVTTWFVVLGLPAVCLCFLAMIGILIDSS